MNNSRKLLLTSIALIAFVQICYSQKFYMRNEMKGHKNNRYRYTTSSLQRKFNNELGRVPEPTRSNKAIYISKRRDRVRV